MKMVYVLFAAVAAAAAVGAARSFAGAPTAATAPPVAIAAETRAAAPDRETAAEASAAIEGEVLETIEVPSYSYLRIGAEGTEGTWVAVPTAGLAVGAHVRVRDAMKMPAFTSTALKRTFPVIYFGTLDDGRPRANAADPHANGAATPHATGVDPHAAAADPQHAPPGAVEVKPVDRAKGPAGRTVAELNTQRTQLAGKTVRIHGTVVKSTPGILGRTYLHLRDGSGDAAAGTHDITVTTEAAPAVGETLVVEGVVVLDRDIGAGYRFATLVENARIVTAP